MDIEREGPAEQPEELEQAQNLFREEEPQEPDLEREEDQKTARLSRKGITGLINKLAGGDSLVISNEFKDVVDRVSQAFMFYVMTT